MKFELYEVENYGGGVYRQLWWQRIHIDPLLLILLLMLAGVGVAILFSASGQNWAMLNRQFVRLGLAFFVMLVVAQVPPTVLREWSPWIFGITVLMLVSVLLFGTVGKGARRWLDLGFIRFQPSELMKLAMPMMVAHYFTNQHLPPKLKNAFIAITGIGLTALMIAAQPDLGTSILVATSGLFVLFLAGLSWRFISISALLSAASAPLVWYLMKEYQRQRVRVFLNPESEPLGAGYHITQSKIALGSGGGYGKGWLNGTQSQLHFLPERSTDFIFAVFGEEFGLWGILLLMALYLAIIGRGLYIAATADSTFGRLLAGSITLTFGIYLIVNTGMVSGLLPVVGVPLPLISYGGTSMVSLMVGFGILMSIKTNRGFLKY